MAAGAMSRILAVGCLNVLMADVCMTISEDHEGGNAMSSAAALVHGVYVDHSNERVRRQAPATRYKRGYNEQEKRAFVDKHNSLRRLEKASDMNYLMWDDDLEALAQGWAENCVFAHRPDRQNIGSYSYAGENVYAGTGGYNPDDVAQLWYDEVSLYNYNTGGCSGVCGHYTQIVWATSRAVGCGVFYCPSLANVNFKRGFLVVCNYGPGGNFVGYQPYKKGQSASQCESEAIFNVTGLCSRYPVIDAAGGAAFTGPASSILGLLPTFLFFYFGFCC